MGDPDDYGLAQRNPAKYSSNRKCGIEEVGREGIVAGIRYEPQLPVIVRADFVILESWAALVYRQHGVDPERVLGLARGDRKMLVRDVRVFVPDIATSTGVIPGLATIVGSSP